MNSQPTLDRSVFRPILSRIAELGARTDALLDRCELAGCWADEAVEQLPESRVWEFFDRSARHLDLPEVGLWTGERLQIRDLGEFGHQLEQSLTLRDCLQTYLQTVNRYSSHARFWLVEREHGVWFCRQGIDLIDLGREYVEQFTLQLMIRLVQLATGPEWAPREASLKTSNATRYTAFDGFHGTAFQTNHFATALWIPHRLMAQPLRRSTDDPLIEHIRRHIAGHVELPALRIDQSAECLGVSRRSLQRELSQRGLDWSRLLDQIRLDRAVALLRSTDVKLIDVAGRLGYQDQANFTRAFRRWTGVAPRTYQRLAAQMDESCG